MNLAYTSKTVIVNNDGGSLMVTTFSAYQTFFSQVETQVLDLMVGAKTNV